MRRDSIVPPARFGTAAVLLSCAVLLATVAGIAATAVPADPEPIKVTRATESGWKIETTIDHRWHPNSVGVAERAYTGAWDCDSVERGDGTCLMLRRRNFLVGSFDGQSYFEIAFQLPADPVIGEPYVCHPIPVDREAAGETRFSETARMRSGEFTAFRFGNPMMGWMEEAGSATVTILETSSTGMRIHVRLIADLSPHFDLDMDEEFDLVRVRSPGGG